MLAKDLKEILAKRDYPDLEWYDEEEVVFFETCKDALVAIIKDPDEYCGILCVATVDSYDNFDDRYILWRSSCEEVVLALRNIQEVLIERYDDYKTSGLDCKDYLNSKGCMEGVFFVIDDGIKGITFKEIEAKMTL